MRTRSEIAEGLKTNLAKFRTLDHQQQEMLWEALEEGRGNVERLVPSGKWHPMHCGNLRDDRRYRLSKRFKPYEFDRRRAAETVSQERAKLLEELKKCKAEKAARKRRKECLDEIKAQIAEEKHQERLEELKAQFIYDESLPIGEQNLAYIGVYQFAEMDREFLEKYLPKLVEKVELERREKSRKRREAEMHIRAEGEARVNKYWFSFT